MYMYMDIYIYTYTCSTIIDAGNLVYAGRFQDCALGSVQCGRATNVSFFFLKNDPHSTSLPSSPQMEASSGMPSKQVLYTPNSYGFKRMTTDLSLNLVFPSPAVCSPRTLSPRQLKGAALDFCRHEYKWQNKPLQPAVSAVAL